MGDEGRRDFSGKCIWDSFYGSAVPCLTKVAWLDFLVTAMTDTTETSESM